MKKLKIKIDFISSLFAIMLFIVLFSMFKVEVVKFDSSFLVCTTFMINLIICLIMIIKVKKSYTLYKTYWYFSFMFFCIAPFIQYLSCYNAWNYSLSNKDYLIANVMILLSNFIYMISYEFKNKFSFHINDKTIIKPEKINIHTKTITKLILFVILVFCFLFTVKNIGFSNLFSRAENSYSVSSNSMFNTVFGLLCRGLPVYIFYTFYSEKNKLNLMSFISLITIIILNFPTSTTRFWMGAIYIGIFLVVVNCDKNKRIYDILILFVFTLVFPFLFLFKFHDINYFLENGIKVKSIVESYNTVDYDAYSIVARSHIFVRDNGIVYGKQFAGTLFFLVPRQIWQNKPTPSGDLIAKAQMQRYTNVSCPFIVEGYINFGVIGIVIFQIVLGLLCARLDYKYWYDCDCCELLRIIYPFLMGFLIYLLRGALHPAVVYLFCFCLPLFLIKFLMAFGGKMSVVVTN